MLVAYFKATQFGAYLCQICVHSHTVYVYVHWVVRVRIFLDMHPNCVVLNA